MGSSALLIILAVMAVGVFVGWHLRHASGANSGLKVHKNRNRSGLTIAALVVFTLLVLRAAEVGGHGLPKNSANKSLTYSTVLPYV